MILYGKPVAQAIEEKLKKEIGGLKEKSIRPFLAVVLVGDDPASALYTRKKREKAESLGIGFRVHHLPEKIDEAHILELIELLNRNKMVHGVLVQLPLPGRFDTDKISKAITPKKDIEKTSPAPLAIMEILEHYKIDLKNKKIVLVGRGKLVGAPLEKILTAQGYEPQVCDSQTLDLALQIRTADIIITAVGKPGLITADMVQENAVIIDAGTAESNGSSVGDVEPLVYEKAKSYSPVPGGVGPVTVAMLYKNLIEAAKEKNEK